MENTPVSIAVCNQKGGVGKSTFTVLLASHLHYTLQRDVLVVDCDYPQWSIYNQRSRELEILNLSDYYKLMVARQFKGTDRKFWPIVSSTPSDALEKTARQLQSDYHPQIILYDLPGTVNTEGVLQILSSLEALFIPIKADKVVLESSLSFARSLYNGMVCNDHLRLRSLHLFWTMVDRRERTPLYERYEAIIRQLHLPVLKTQIPYRSKFNKELLADGTGIGRSTLLAPERTFTREAQIENLAAEILSILQIS